MKKESKSKSMYGNSPKLGRDEKGKVVEMKGETKKPEMNPQDADEGMPMHAKHMLERNMMHSRHESEHSMAAHTGVKEKLGMHKSHEKEMSDMHRRHEKESMGAN